MKTAIIIHGAYGRPEDNWFPWLKQELEKLNYNVFVPRFPTPENQNLNNWLRVFEDYKDFLGPDTIVIGHSLGVAFFLRVLEKINFPIKASFFVSGFISFLDNNQFDEINKTFLEKDFDWEKIKQNCKKYFILSSDNDPYVPLSKGEDIARNLDSKLIVVPGAGHICTGSGYTKFDLLLEKIKELN